MRPEGSGACGGGRAQPRKGYGAVAQRGAKLRAGRDSEVVLPDDGRACEPLPAKWPASDDAALRQTASGAINTVDRRVQRA